MASAKAENHMDDEESVRVLYEGKEPIQADIVFVHGLTGNGLATWEKADTVWPRDLLPKAIPGARIITWNYDADIMRFFNKTGQNTILKHAENFLLDLAGERAEEDGIEPDRPIIFVGHSLGGLVIKQALITAREHEYAQNENDDYANILRNTVGIIFLGTPHKGSDQAKWDGIATNLAKVLRKDHNDTIIGALSRGSSTLENLQSSFAGISDRFSYSTFTEEREYPNIGKIVDDDSATLYLTKEYRASLPANHLGMSRFGSHNETGFKRVVIAVKSLLRAAAMRDPIRHNSTSSLPQARDFQGYRGPGVPPQGYPPAAYDYRRYAPDAPGPFYEPDYYPPGRGYPGYGQRYGAYGNPNLDESGLPVMLDRVSIAPSMSDTDTLVGPVSPTSTNAQLATNNLSQDTPAEEPKADEPDVSAEVADEVAAAEEAEPEEENAEAAAEEPEEPAIPSPITRDMYVRLVQEFSDKEKAPDQEFQEVLNRINFYRKRVADRLFLARARAQIEIDHTIPEDVATEIAARIYGPTHAGATCDVCSGSPDVFHHCVNCNDNGYDICQGCLDKGNKCPGDHPLIKFTKITEEGATGEAQPEEESLFPFPDELDEFDVNDQETIVRTLYLAALLGKHDDIISKIVQYGTDCDSQVNKTPNAGASRIRLTPLALAILTGQDEAVSTLLNAQPNMLVYRETVNPVQDEQEETLEETEPLREEMGDEAATTDDSAVADNEGDSDEDTDSEFDTVSESTAIEAIKLAASHGNAQTVKLLLLQWGQDPLPAGHNLLHDAAECGHAESIDILINWGADIEEKNPYYLRTPLLHSASLSADIAKIETLVRRRANVDAQDKDSKTALHYAAVNNRLDTVQMLVDAKANLEIEDKDGNTPIHYIVEQPEYYALAKYMVQKGVSLKHKNKAGLDPLDLAVNSKADNGETYLMLAVSITSPFHLGLCWHFLRIQRIHSPISNLHWASHIACLGPSTFAICHRT